MVKKQTTKPRTKVKDLPKKGKKLSAGVMKKVKGGMQDVFVTELYRSAGNTKPGVIK